MDGFVFGLMTQFGYFGMFLGMVLEAVIIIIPSEFILATAGILAGRGIFSFSLAFLTGLIGSVFCAIVLYAMGYFGGRTFIQKYGKYFFMKEEDLDKCDHWFQKYGMASCFIGRNFPIIRTLISIPIGFTRQPFFKFVIYTTLGSIPWTFAFVYVGYALGNNWVLLSEFTKKLKVPILFLLALLLFRFFYQKLTNRKKKKGVTSPSGNEYRAYHKLDR